MPLFKLFLIPFQHIFFCLILDGTERQGPRSIKAQVMIDFSNHIKKLSFFCLSHNN